MPEYDDETAQPADEESSVETAETDESVEAAAEVLVWAGALDRDTAEAVLAGFTTAWELRGGRADQRARPFPRRPAPGSAPLTGPVPIAIDFGIPLVKGPFDQKQLVAFYVGFGNF